VARLDMSAQVFCTSSANRPVVVPGRVADSRDRLGTANDAFFGLHGFDQRQALSRGSVRRAIAELRGDPIDRLASRERSLAGCEHTSWCRLLRATWP
jgi:hypothetical protein